MKRHIMVDLETWGAGQDAVIISIGAVRFDPYDAHSHENFHVCVSPQGQERFNRKIDASTILWWMGLERAEALRAWVGSEQLDLMTALEGFALWYGDEDQPVWGNGASFDNVILRSAYEATGMECPWKFWNDRCFRTLKSLAPRNLEPRREGVHHNALDDAMHQVDWLHEVVEATSVIL